MRIHVKRFSIALVFCTSLWAQIFPQSDNRGAYDPDQRERQQGQSSSTSGTSSQPLPDTTVRKESITNSPADNVQSPNATPAGTSRTTQRTLPPEPSTEFQDFVYASTGTVLPIFGRQLFQEPPSTFAPVDRVAVSSEYVIGPGDQIILRGWGSIDIDYRGTVDQSGNFFIPKIGTTSVAGLKYGDLYGFLKNFIGKNYRNFELNVALGQLRSVRVFVVGNARQPGAYTLSALSTLVNAVFAAGGPSGSGSMRSIQLRRGSRLVVDFDLYDLLVRGDKSKDVMLEPGDVIFIAPVSAQVAVLGSVNTPAIYEVRSDETLDQVLKSAGGLTPIASGQRVTVERIDDRRVRRVQEFDLDPAGLAQKMKDGDLITVRSLTARFDNAVTLRGNLANPGRYPWRQGMRVRDLIPTRDALITRDYWLKQDQLVKQDPRLSIPTAKPSSEDDRNAQISDKTTVKAERGRELKNDIRRNGADINWEYAVIQRLNPQDLTTRLIPFHLAQAIEGNPADNIQLEAGDVITIFSQNDIAVSVTKKTVFVRLEGEFATAGVYQAMPGETLRALVKRVGGLSPDAFLYGAVLTRESVRVEQQKRLDDFVTQSEKDLEAAATRNTRNVTNPGDVVGLNAAAESQRRLIDKFKTIRAQGRVVLDIKPGDNDPATLPELVLEDGDALYVPYRASTVNVIGAVYNDNSFLFEENRKVSDYLRRAGGTTRNGDKGNVFVIRANGNIEKAPQSSAWFSSGDRRVLPGDTIVVPQQVSSIGWMRGLRDWSQIFAQLAIGVAGLHSIAN